MIQPTKDQNDNGGESEENNVDTPVIVPPANEVNNEETPEDDAANIPIVAPVGDDSIGRRIER